MTTQTISHILTQLLRERLEKRFNTTFPDLFVRIVPVSEKLESTPLHFEDLISGDDDIVEEVLKFFGVDKKNANYYYLGDPYDSNSPLVVEFTIKCDKGFDGNVKVWVWV